MESQSVAGGWLGTYYYRSGGGGSTTRFEATLAMLDRTGRFDGTILDDGVMGEATVSDGRQIANTVHFTKIYQRPPATYEAVPVEYEGTLSPDGRVLTGTWSLRLRSGGRNRTMQGTWEAHRLWHDRADAESERDTEFARRELVEIGR